MNGPYRINLWYYGVLQKTISGLTKQQAKECFFTHFDNFDGCVEVTLGKTAFSIGQAIKHFGKRKAKAEVILTKKREGRT